MPFRSASNTQHPLKKGDIHACMAVKIGPELIDVYIIEEKAFYHYNFIILY